MPDMSGLSKRSELESDEMEGTSGTIERVPNRVFFEASSGHLQLIS
jgi:hypothetical protein